MSAAVAATVMMASATAAVGTKPRPAPHRTPAPPAPTTTVTAAPPAEPTHPPPPDSGADGMGGAVRITGHEVLGYVAFTFDDGPDPAYTPRILDALARHDVPATFFVVGRHLVGKHVDDGSVLVARELADGHMIGSHTLHHVNLKHAPPDVVRREIEGSYLLLAELLERPVTMFRPPYGAIGGVGLSLLARHHLTQVRWSIDSKDWQTPNPRLLRTRLLQTIIRNGGGVVLLHDTKPQTAAAIEGILEDLEHENCRRLGAGQPMLVPVSLHYFVVGRSLPDEVAARTQRYVDAMPARCAALLTPP